MRWSAMYFTRVYRFFPVNNGYEVYTNRFNRNFRYEHNAKIVIGSLRDFPNMGWVGVAPSTRSLS
jgi:hypothetical protein